MQSNSQFYFYAIAGTVFVKDASLYFTNRGHKHRRREIAITSAKHEAERNEDSTTASEGAI